MSLAYRNGNTHGGCVLAFEPRVFTQHLEGIRDMSEYQDITFESIGAVARISTSTQRRNAEGTQLLDELGHALDRVAADDEVRVVIIGGTGDHFSAGHDVKEAMGRPDLVEKRYAYEEARYLAFVSGSGIPQSPPCAGSGACLAGGFMVANMCDLMVAADDAYFADSTCVRWRPRRPKPGASLGDGPADGEGISVYRMPNVRNGGAPHRDGQ